MRAGPHVAAHLSDMTKQTGVTDLNEFRARKRHPAGSKIGGRFAPTSRTEASVELPSQAASGAPDPWGDPDFTPAAPRPKVTLVPAADGAGGPASSAPPAGTARQQRRPSVRKLRDRLATGLRSLAENYRNGFAGSMEDALTTVDRLTSDVAALAPCVSKEEHRRLAGVAAKRIIRHVDTRSTDLDGAIQECLAEAEKANQAAYNRGVRAPTHQGR